MGFHIYQDMVGQWRWYLAAPNGAKIAVAPVGYARRDDCALAVQRVREGAEAPLVYDQTGLAFNSVAAAMVA